MSSVQSRSVSSSKNAITSVSSRLLFLLVNFVSRTFFIKFLGEACLGLNGLFTTILSILSLAEMGIGEAIAFYLYKPIAEGDNERLSKLVHFYKICYRVIGCVVMVVGLSLMPFLPALINLESDPGYNIYLLFFLYLLNSSITYFLFSYPQTVLIANQKQYAVNLFTIAFQLIIFTADIITLFLTKNFIVYLAVRLSLTCLQNFFVYLYCRKRYPYIVIKPKEKISKDEIKSMFKDVYGVFVLKLSSKLIDSTDNLFISFFLGTILVGYNSNYLMIVAAATSLINSIIFAFCAGIGDYNVTHSREDVYKLFNVLDYLNFVLSFSSAIMIFSFSNHFITLLWGEKFVFSIAIVAFMSFNFYVVTSIYAVHAFRQALGVFRKSMYFQLFAALLNIALDFALIHVLGILGLYIATVTSNLLFAVFPFAKSLFDKEHNKEFVIYFLKTLTRYVYVIAFGALAFYVCSFYSVDVWGFVFRVLTTVGIIAVALLLTGLFDKNPAKLVSRIKALLKGRTIQSNADANNDGTRGFLADKDSVLITNQCHEEKPFITFFIPTFKRADTLRETLDSIKRNCLSFPYQILILDNSANFGDDNAVRKVIREYSSLPIDYFINKENLGMEGNWNQGIVLSKSDYVCFVHDDDLIASNYGEFIEKIISLMHRNKRCAFFKARYDFFSGYEQIEQLEGKENQNKYIYKCTRAASLVNGDNQTYTPSCGMVFKKSAVIDVGGFDPSFHPSADNEIGTRMLKKKYYGLASSWVLGHYRLGVNESMETETIQRFVEKDYLIRHNNYSLSFASKIFSWFFEKYQYSSRIDFWIKYASEKFDKTITVEELDFKKKYKHYKRKPFLLRVIGKIDFLFCKKYRI